MQNQRIYKIIKIICFFLCVLQNKLYICSVRNKQIEIMTKVKTNQITFGKQTMKQLLSLVPTARTKRKVGTDYVIKDAEGNTVATWQKQRLTNGLLVIW